MGSLATTQRHVWVRLVAVLAVASLLAAGTAVALAADGRPDGAKPGAVPAGTEEVASETAEDDQDRSGARVPVSVKGEELDPGFDGRASRSKPQSLPPEPVVHAPVPEDDGDDPDATVVHRIETSEAAPRDDGRAPGSRPGPVPVVEVNAPALSPPSGQDGA